MEPSAPPDVSAALAGLASRVRAIEAPPVASAAVPAAPGAVVAAAPEFVRMDNPWMWLTLVGIAVVVFGLWHFLGRKPVPVPDDDDDDVPPALPSPPVGAPWPSQTTPMESYQQHFG